MSSVENNNKRIWFTVPRLLERTALCVLYCMYTVCVFVCTVQNEGAWQPTHLTHNTHCKTAQTYCTQLLTREYCLCLSVSGPSVTPHPSPAGCHGASGTDKQLPSTVSPCRPGFRLPRSIWLRLLLWGHAVRDRPRPACCQSRICRWGNQVQFRDWPRREVLLSSVLQVHCQGHS